jgi:hypothetical protein
MKYSVWKRPDFGEFACWRLINSGLSKEDADKLVDKIDREDCDCSVAAIEDGKFPPGYESERAFLRRGY